MSDLRRTMPAGSVARIEIGGTPPREVAAFWANQDTGRPWASISDLKSAEVFETNEYISDLGVASSNVKLVPAGTPIMSFKLTIGRTSIAGRDLYTNEAIAAFYCDDTDVDRRFLFHALPGAAASLITDVAVKGATLNKKSLAMMALQLPPLGEQRRIAEILDTLDDQIRSTEQIVEKLQHLRTGLLRDLVVALEGVGQDDAVSGPLDNFVSWLSGGTPSKDARQFWGGLTPWLTPKDMKSLIVGRTADSLTPLGVAAGSRLAPIDAVFIVVRGMILAHTFPVSRMTTAATFNQDIKAVVPRSGILPNYLMYWFVAHADTMLRLVGESTHGTKKLDLPDLKAVPAVFPSPNEQARVLSILEAQERAIDRGMEMVAKLRLQKTGLLMDLLTGRVRAPLEAAS